MRTTIFHSYHGNMNSYRHVILTDTPVKSTLKTLNLCPWALQFPCLSPVRGTIGGHLSKTFLTWQQNRTSPTVQINAMPSRLQQLEMLILDYYQEGS